MRFLVVLGLASVVASVACDKPAQTPPAARMGGAAAPHPMMPASAAPSLKGKLTERIDAGTYSYLRLATTDGDVWAAVPQTTLEVGADVAIANPMLMQNFESKTLNRTFEKVYFGTVGGPMAQPMPAMGAGNTLPEGHPAVAGGAAPTAPPIVEGTPMPSGHPSVVPGTAVAAPPVAKATGADAKTVMEIWSQKATLAEKPVTIHATVVKASNGILGKNWLHLRDGSGTDAAQDNDVTVTSAAGTAAVGDVVTVKGIVRLAKDFGAGYAYPVIIEDATVTKD